MIQTPMSGIAREIQFWLDNQRDQIARKLAIIQARKIGQGEIKDQELLDEATASVKDCCGCGDDC